MFIQMAVLFILIAVEYVARRAGLMDDVFNARLSSWVIAVACPCLVLSSVMGDTLPDIRMVPPLLAVGFGSHILLTFMGYQLPRRFCRVKARRGVYGFMITFGNIGFIGYPVVSALFGRHAVFYASILMLPYTVFAFTYGISMVSGQRQQFNFRVLCSPMMVASLLAILIVLAGWHHFPIILSRPLHLVGDVTVPLALAIIGSSLAKVPLRGLWDKPSLYALSLQRLIIAPVGIFVLAAFCGLDMRVNEINAVLTAMPVSTYGTMFCYRCGKDDTLMTQGTCLTTLLSMATVPLLVMMLRAVETWIG